RSRYKCCGRERARARERRRECSELRAGRDVEHIEVWLRSERTVRHVVGRSVVDSETIDIGFTAGVWRAERRRLVERVDLVQPSAACIRQSVQRAGRGIDIDTAKIKRR